MYLQRLAFGGKVSGRNFGVESYTSAGFDVSKLGPLLADIHERLAGGVIECLPWQDFIKRYDRPSALFYLDPPYWGTEHYYGRGLFDRSGFDELANRLATIKGKFILSVNDAPGTREVFGRFHVEGVNTRYPVSRGDSSSAAEILVTGPDCRAG